MKTQVCRRVSTHSRPCSRLWTDIFQKNNSSSYIEPLFDVKSDVKWFDVSWYLIGANCHNNLWRMRTNRQSAGPYWGKLSKNNSSSYIAPLFDVKSDIKWFEVSWYLIGANCHNNLWRMRTNRQSAGPYWGKLSPMLNPCGCSVPNMVIQNLLFSGGGSSHPEFKPFFIS